MKIKLSGRMNLEQFSHQIQLAIAKLQDSGVKYMKGCNLYFTPVDREGEEVNIWNDKKKPIKEMTIPLEPNPPK